MSEPVVDWFLVNQLVKPEHQYLEVDEPPLDSVRMAWPFKTEEELKAFSKWFRKEQQKQKQKQIKEHVEKHGEAFL